VRWRRSASPVRNGGCWRSSRCKDGLPQTQLANELDVGKVAVGALIDRLEASGFVLRQADPVDRRVKRVYVTKQARGFLEKLRKETDKFNAQIVHGIDRKQLEAASEALLAMKHNLLAMSDEYGGPTRPMTTRTRFNPPRPGKSDGRRPEAEPPVSVLLREGVWQDLMRPRLHETKTS
jgi:DNA-binding MarR family transcriptional regulator